MQDEPPLTAQQVLNLYASGQRDFRGTDIDDRGGETSLAGACLDGADFSGAFIVADFSGASLQKARFARANVKTCIFNCANLAGADFSEAALDAATFENANLASSTFAGARIQSHIFEEGERP